MSTNNVTGVVNTSSALPKSAAQAAAPGFSTDLDAAIQASEVAANWGQQGAPGIAGDKNGDGRVDIFDIAFISSAMNQAHTAADAGESADATAGNSADANSDGQVDAADVDVVSANWGHEGQAGRDGDVNSDGRVDIFDVAEVSNNWTDPSASQSASGDENNNQVARRGDVNGDGVVDSRDLDQILAAWGQSGAGAMAGDVNGDGQVDIFDIADLSADWPEEQISS